MDPQRLRKRRKRDSQSQRRGRKAKRERKRKTTRAHQLSGLLEDSPSSIASPFPPLLLCTTAAQTASADCPIRTPPFAPLPPSRKKPQRSVFSGLPLLWRRLIAFHCGSPRVSDRVTQRRVPPEGGHRRQGPQGRCLLLPRRYGRGKGEKERKKKSTRDPGPHHSPHPRQPTSTACATWS